MGPRAQVPICFRGKGEVPLAWVNTGIGTVKDSFLFLVFISLFLTFSDTFRIQILCQKCDKQACCKAACSVAGETERVQCSGHCC